MKPQWICSIEDDGRILLRCLDIDENGVTCPVEMKLLPNQAEHLGNALLSKAAEAKRTPLNPHSFTPDPETDDELCLTCRMPLDHPNHSESW